jgi:hypothetical protein
LEVVELSAYRELLDLEVSFWAVVEEFEPVVPLIPLDEVEPLDEPEPVDELVEFDVLPDWPDGVEEEVLLPVAANAAPVASAPMVTRAMRVRDADVK